MADFCPGLFDDIFSSESGDENENIEVEPEPSEHITLEPKCELFEQVQQSQIEYARRIEGTRVNHTVPVTNPG